MRTILVFLLLILSIASFAQDLSLFEQNNFEQLKVDRLQRIQLEISKLDNTIFSLEQNLAREQRPISKIRFENKLKAAREEREKKRLEFIETATNINLDSSDTETQEKKDFVEQLKELVEPILKSIRDASERPRKMQEYKEKLSLLSERHENAQEAIRRLRNWQKSNTDKKLDESISKSIQKAEELSRQINIRKEDLDFKIQKIEREKGSLATEISNLIFGFFKNKGRNLFFALVVFLFSFWALKRMGESVISFTISRLNRNLPEGQSHWIARPLRILYSVNTLIISLFFAILTLYLLNDFVLVTFIIFILAAILWSTKGFLPGFLDESKLILNLGPIREGERIIFNGLPWEIKNLGFFCRLENPALAGGNLRISSKKLLDHYSRAANWNEPWFPSKVGDWVELADETYGKVIMQTPEQVTIKLVGSETRYMSASEFFSQTPTNLSQGFAVEFTFGLDYSHQKILFSEIIPNFKKEIYEGLMAEYPQNEKEFKEFSIDFCQANASSLDLRFFLKCSGELASRKNSLNRKINALFVEVCNRHDYIIPFNQLTVHMAHE